MSSKQPKTAPITCTIDTPKQKQRDNLEYKKNQKKYLNLRKKLKTDSTEMRTSLSQKYGANIKNEKIKKAEKYLTQITNCHKKYGKKEVFQVRGYTPFTLGAMLKRKGATKIQVFKPGNNNGIVYKRSASGEFYNGNKRALVVGREVVVILSKSNTPPSTTAATATPQKLPERLISKNSLLTLRQKAKKGDKKAIEHLQKHCLKKYHDTKINTDGYQFIGTGIYNASRLSELFSKHKTLFIVKANNLKDKKRKLIILKKRSNGEFYANGAKKRMYFNKNDVVFTIKQMAAANTAVGTAAGQPAPTPAPAPTPTPAPAPTPP